MNALRELYERSDDAAVLIKRVHLFLTVKKEYPHIWEGLGDEMERTSALDGRGSAPTIVSPFSDALHDAFGLEFEQVDTGKKSNPRVKGWVVKQLVAC